MSVLFVTESTLSYCDGNLGYPDGSLFVMVEDEALAILESNRYDRGGVCRALGLPEAAWQGHRVFMVNVPTTELRNLRVPSGNEMGVDNTWIPGGVHRNGFKQAVINPVPLTDCQMMEIKWKS
jgi:hypothetical protein